MTSPRRLRIALLTHSTNPRGGVVHVTQLGNALAALGHDVVVHAPDPERRGFVSKLKCGYVPVPAAKVAGPLAGLVTIRIAEYTDYFQHRSRMPFDLYHAHDGIGGCALANLVRSGHIGGFIRTVHHLDQFENAYLAERQNESIASARQVLCVSRLWANEIQQRFGIVAEQVTNGVDLARFTPTAKSTDDEVRTRIGVRKQSPVFLSVGGIEMRKNTTRLLQAFTHVIRKMPDAQLLIVGGASLLDHSAYRQSFDAVLNGSDLVVGRDVIQTGPVPDDDLAALMRCATALVFPSLIEGFGLVVLEAMASGTPVVVSRIPPFTEYLSEADCAWADPMDVESIASAMLRASDTSVAATLRVRGLEVSQRYSWERCARTHEMIYSRLFEEFHHAGNAVRGSMA